MSINYADAGSTAGNRIVNPTGAAVNCNGVAAGWAVATLQYNGAQAAWILVSHS
jgi:hypothetical protein